VLDVASLIGTGRAHVEAFPTCVTSEADVGGPHLHAHQQARAHSSTRTSMLWRVQALQVHAGVGGQAQQLHAGQALSACGSGGASVACRANAAGGRCGHPEVRALVTLLNETHVNRHAF
jgi:hypothetical protein